MTTAQDTQKSTVAAVGKAASTPQKEVDAKQETGATGATQKTGVQKSASAQGKPTTKASSTPARRATASKSAKRPARENSAKNTSVDSNHIADQVSVIPSRRVWPD